MLMICIKISYITIIYHTGGYIRKTSTNVITNKSGSCIVYNEIIQYSIVLYIAMGYYSNYIDI